MNFDDDDDNEDDNGISFTSLQDSICGNRKRLFGWHQSCFRRRCFVHGCPKPALSL